MGNHQRAALVFVVVFAVLGLCVLIAGIVVVHKQSAECEEASKRLHPLQADCTWSEHSQSIGLKQFLLKVQQAYYLYNPQNLPWKPDTSDEEMRELLREK